MMMHMFVFAACVFFGHELYRPINDPGHEIACKVCGRKYSADEQQAQFHRQTKAAKARIPKGTM